MLRVRYESESRFTSAITAACVKHLATGSMQNQRHSVRLENERLLDNMWSEATTGWFTYLQRPEIFEFVSWNESLRERRRIEVPFRMAAMWVQCKVKENRAVTSSSSVSTRPHLNSNFVYTCIVQLGKRVNGSTLMGGNSVECTNQTRITHPVSPQVIIISGLASRICRLVENFYVKILTLLITIFCSLPATIAIWEAGYFFRLQVLHGSH